MTGKIKTVKIDDVEYELDSLSEEAKTQLTNLRITDAEIRQIQTRLALTQTARSAYASALKAELDKPAEMVKH